MNKTVRLLVPALLALAAVPYLGGVLWAGIASLQSQSEPDLPDVVSQAITAIGSVLAIHTGAAFGVSGFVEDSRTRRILDRARIPQHARGEMRSPTEKIQVIAVVVYAVSLILAAVFWGLDDGFSPTSALVLRNMSYTLIGLLAGLLAVQLNVASSQTQL